ncbi:uncharacterized protein V1510DRAFT_405130 [Dipodascopsis tothii]|uniref:uncharacterized protein n=1 Tax=Dipodascopsis tothii TaxID=44089 RepID=UPI0034CD8DBB
MSISLGSRAMLRPVRLASAARRPCPARTARVRRAVPRPARAFHASARAANVPKDPYGALGVGKSATEKEIKQAYRQLAKKYHPDVNKEPGADKKFHDVQAAYELLSDPEKKAQFDQFGAGAFDPSGGFGGGGAGAGAYGNPFGGGFGGFGGFNAGAQGFNFEDIFSAFAGGAGGQARGRRGNVVEEYRGDDIEVLATISFVEAAKGKTVQVDYHPLLKCDTCTGTGLKTGHKKSTCPTCRGTGTHVQMIQGGFSMATTCPTCAGAGVYIDPKSECPSCHAKGTKKTTRKTEVDIPAGIEDGMRLRVTGEGDTPDVLASANVRLHRGDLFVRVKIRPHAEFTRKGAELFYTAEIPMTTAALGGRVRIPTLDGAAELNVPAATQSGTAVTMSGKGMPRLQRRNQFGDLKITFKVNTLRPATERQVELLEQLADAFNDPTAKRRAPKNDPGTFERARRPAAPRPRPAPAAPAAADPPVGPPEPDAPRPGLVRRAIRWLLGH